MVHLRQDPIMRSRLLRQIRHNVERSLDMEITEVDPRAQLKEEPSQPQVQGQAAASAMVQGWREPRTLTTLSFIDGFVARGYVTCKVNTIPRATIAKINREMERYLHIAEPQPKSHVWAEGSLIPYLDFLAGELRARRKALGLTGQHRALILMDQAGAHMSRTFETIQRKWCEENNVDTLFEH